MSRSGYCVLFAGLAAALGGCERTALSGPPELRLGRDNCAECGMLIVEDRCAAAMLVETDGFREHLLFDDIGCMLARDRDTGHGSDPVARFVRDHSARSWIDADRAILVVADPDRIATPMASGLIAFGTEADATAKAVELEGTTARYADLLHRSAQAARGDR